jgi:hypothetical protein
MSIWSSIPGTFALHYENSATDPRKAKRMPGFFPDEFGDEVDLAVVPNYVYNDTDVSDGYLPYLRLGLIVDNAAAGDVILNRNQVKKLRNELNQFLKDTKKKKVTSEEEKSSMCDFIWDNHGNHACTFKMNHIGDHECCCKVKDNPAPCRRCNESVITCGLRENGNCCNHCDHS